MSKDNELKKTLGLFTAVGLAITMVVGSGLLILPGLAYQKVGSAAIYAWGISALISIPLLIVFARLGAEIPGAGGVAGFMQAAFSRREGAATEILILGTIPGGAAIAITGGKYLRALFDGNLGLEILGCFSIFLVGGR
jgi:amino acid efflux transporter